MNGRFTGQSHQAYVTQASRRLHKRVKELTEGTRKPRDIFDFIILNPSIVDSIYNNLK